jgi:hypothetical protein
MLYDLCELASEVPLAAVLAAMEDDRGQLAPGVDDTVVACLLAADEVRLSCAPTTPASWPTWRGLSGTNDV